MKIVVGQGSCGLAAGAKALCEALDVAAGTYGLDVEFGITGCIGMCYLEPIVDVYDENGRRTYVRVLAPDADAFIADLKAGAGETLDKLAISDEDKDVMAKQTRIALRNCGNINPEFIEEYIAADGYVGL